MKQKSRNEFNVRVWEQNEKNIREEIASVYMEKKRKSLFNYSGSMCILLMLCETKI